MNVIIHPGALSGEVIAPSSKSEAHRLLICAAFAPGTTDVDCTSTSADIDATISCLEALGARVARTRTGFRVRPVPGSSASDNLPEPSPHATLDCGESGSTLRFMLPVVCALGRGAELVCRGRLPQRPLSPLYEQLVEHGATLSPQGASPLEVSGRIRSGRYALPGNVSSQYVSGLLLAAPLLRAPVEVVVGEPVESLPYIDLTVAALERFGVEVSCAQGADEGGAQARVYDVCAPDGLVSPGSVAVGGDWSNAAFWLVAGAIGERGVAVRGLDARSAQGDRRVLSALAMLGARVLRTPAGSAVRPAALRGAAIRALGGSVRASADGLEIDGSPRLRGGVVDAANDHRIAMMAAVLATRCEGPTTILGAECVEKSYPRFFDDLASLGGVVEREA